MHINHLLQRHDWVADTVSFRINAKTARGIVDGPEILEPGPADDLTRAARKVMLDAARDNEDCRVELVPVSGESRVTPIPHESDSRCKDTPVSPSSFSSICKRAVRTLFRSSMRKPYDATICRSSWPTSRLAFRQTIQLSFGIDWVL